MIGIVGLGYVGLPLACLLSEKYSVLGLDHDHEKLKQIALGDDPCGELSADELKKKNLTLSSHCEDLKKCKIIIVCVPTPVSQANKPNLEPLLRAAREVGNHLSPGSIVVFESTVYPGVTETLCADALMQGGLRREQFKLGYSPERVNPGDKVNRTNTIVKLVAGEDQQTLQVLLELYGSIAPVYPCTTIKVAEATKLFENVQRDINIAYVNEFMQLCNRSEIAITDVLQAAKTKWNALNFHPGMVGGDCIYADPYYALEWREQCRLGTNLSVISTARHINVDMPSYYAERIRSKVPVESKMLILGMSFKKNVRDTRNSGALKLRELLARDYRVYAYDPLADVDNLDDWPEIPEVDTVLLAVNHDIFSTLSWQEKLKPSGIFIELENV